MSEALKILGYMDEIKNCGSAIELLPIAQDIRERSELSDSARAVLQERINQQLAKISTKKP
jgi:hypothetical protein